tara:strand:- start:119 stop:817 length:699 start_codon:yes stop_codon:yes gene_type:complete
MGFKMRSGNGPLPFKQMASSPAKQSTGFDKAFSSAAEELGPDKTFEYKNKSYSTNRADGKDMRKSLNNIKEISRVKPKELKVEIAEGPVKPKKLEDVVGKTSSKSDIKTKKKFDKNEFRKHMQALGSSRTFQGKGAKSYSENLATANKAESDEKRAKTADARSKKIFDTKYSDEQIALDNETQRTDIKRKKQLIANAEKVNNQEHKLEGVKSLAAGTSGDTYADKVVKKYKA